MRIQHAAGERQWRATRGRRGIWIAVGRVAPRILRLGATHVDKQQQGEECTHGRCRLGFALWRGLGQYGSAREQEAKAIAMTKDELTAWALASGWKMINGFPSLSKPGR